MFQAIVLNRNGEQFEAAVRSIPEDELERQTPGTDVLLEVEYSTVNFKDALALTNRSPIARRWPMVAGVDCAGRVAASQDPRWRVGDRVVLNGWGASEQHWGGLAQKARVRGEWLVALPSNFTTRQAMAIGTAGYTAALSVVALERLGLQPSQGDVLITGATGGVGSIAIALLAARGYRIVASTGKPAESDYLTRLGAGQIIDRKELAAPGKPLQTERWAAAVDSLGSHTLANVCAQIRRGGAVAACGLAQGMDLPATVAPFILRGVSLLGIDSVMAPLPRRQAAWQVLSESLDPARLESMVREVPLAGAFDVAREILEGRNVGRVVVDVNR
ncbi:MAG TPA: MDR family oxidoreductase [Burkholderiaceae bacterium]|jgi:acrylyl-CoA reductase (NADPH)|nr:MDR family oxidoreductase [Burkholderiaceae bacterium]